MNGIYIFDYSDKNILTFIPLSDDLGLPFPLYLSMPSKILLFVFMLIGLIYGLKLRFLIFSYLKAPGTNNPGSVLYM